MFVEVRRKDWMESFAHHLVTLGLMYYRWGRLCLLCAGLGWAGPDGRMMRGMPCQLPLAMSCLPAARCCRVVPTMHVDSAQRACWLRAARTPLVAFHLTCRPALSLPPFSPLPSPRLPPRSSCAARSWWANFVRPGVIVMLLHDVSDIFLEGAKLARYAQRDDLAMKLFITFAGTWVACRCLLFPYLIVGRMLVDPVTDVALPFNVDPQPHYAVFGTLFLSLFCLHLYWTYLIWRVIARQLRTGSTDDVREDDDDD